MESMYDRICTEARAYLDTRQNEVHTSICVTFARRLLRAYPDASEGVVLPAVMLHDVGWKMVPEEKQLGAFGPNAHDTEALRLHEREGARIAGEILRALGYDGEKTKEITAIIDGHDSRREALSLNDSLVKDSDKLWRYTPTGVAIDHVRFGIDRKEYLEWLGTTIDGWLFTGHARVMAREAFEQTLAVRE
jgi:hypothetical protein